MDDNIPDICVLCGYIIGHTEQCPDTCDKCRRQGVDSVERGLDPWHEDAFPDNLKWVGTTGERRQGWYALDWCGNVIGFVPDKEKVIA